MFLSDQERNETIWACRFCMMCYVADRVASVVRQESYSPRGRAAILWGLEQGFLEWNEEVADIMYTAINDGLLEKWCVGNYNYEELIVDTRARLFKKGLAPEEVRRFVEQLDAGRDQGPQPADILSQAGVSTSADAELVLFGGCSARSQQAATLQQMGRLFNQAGVPFKVLSDEPCCGWPLYQLGDFDRAAAFSKRVTRMFKDAGAKQVVVLDADCFRMFTTRTSRFGGDIAGLTFRHAVQLLAEWLADGKLEVASKISGPVTYHDPCALARYRVELEAPRAILSKIVDGEIREMESSGKTANCCGAGGMLPEVKPQVAAQVTGLRLNEAAETGAALMATACTRCDATFRGALQADRSLPKIEVSNLIDLVARSVGVG